MRSCIPILASSVLVSTALACGSSSSPAGTGTTSGTKPDGGGSSGNDAGTATATTSVDVVQHHKNATRDGVYVDSTMTKAVAATLKLDATFAPTITGNVYAQPLYVSNGPGGKEAFVVVTEQNHAMAIDGTGKTIWEHPSSATDTTTYGTPVTNSRTVLGCGNIDPLGVTGTPVIDTGSRTLYFDAMTLSGTTPTHQLYAVSLDDGTIKTGWPIVLDKAVKGFTSQHQNQRGALLLAGGVVYAVYGGHDGDCDNPPYHGWVVGVDTTNPSTVTSFSTGSVGTNGSSQGGIWAPGGLATDGTSLFISTGNTGGTGGTWSGGEAILRLDPSLTFTNAMDNEFYPMEWMADDTADQDLGSVNPVVLDMPGAPVPHLIVALGKDGYLYLLNRDALGGEAGELSRVAVAPQGAGGRGSLNGAPAVYTAGGNTYVAYRINDGPGTGCPSGGATGGIGVAQISAGTPPTAKVVWCSADAGLGSPMVTSSGTSSATDVIVWNASTHLIGYDGVTGASVLNSADAMASSMHYFNTPIDANGRMVVATSGPGHLYVFKAP